MGKKILILGAGFGGLEAATGLREGLGAAHDITLIDKNDHFIIGFSKFEVLFGRHTAAEVKSYYRDLAAPGVRFVQETITAIDPERAVVTTETETETKEYDYDYLIVGLGAELAPELMPGFVEGGYEFYSLSGAERLAPVLADFSGGAILLSIFGKPYKCPPAPYEAAFQLHDYYVNKGIRDQVQIKMLIPAAVPLPVAPGAAEVVQARFAERGIELLTQHKVTGLDPAQKLAHIANRPALPYDLFIGVPHHRPPAVVRQSPLGQTGWIPVNKQTLQTNYPNVYAVGDVTKIPVGDLAVPKAGAFAEAAAKTVVSDIIRRITGQGETIPFEAVGTCFLEFGEGEVAQISANYLGQAEPQARLEEPSAELRAGKQAFEDDRINRWFKTA